MKNCMILFISIVFILAGCTDKRPVFPTYQGQTLKIAVVGEPPAIRETSKVDFTILQIDEITPENVSSYDALWLRGVNNFGELAKSQYASTFESITIPIVFEEPKKGTGAFFDNRDGYENLLDSGSLDYANVIFPPKKAGDPIREEVLGLYNDERDLETIRDVYSRILGSVEQYK